MEDETISTSKDVLLTARYKTSLLQAKRKQLKNVYKSLTH